MAVASSWNEVTPCNLHLNGLAAAAKEGVRQAGAVPLEFGTIAVSDGISMGTEGMKASLVSREVIADSVELMVHAEQFDALVAIAGCDKSLPGMLMACARLNIPPRSCTAGPSCRAGARAVLTIQDVFEAVGGHAAGDDVGRRAADDRARRLPGRRIVRRHVHGEHDVGVRRGARHGAARRAPAPAVSAERTELARRTGEAAVQALARRPAAARRS